MISDIKIEYRNSFAGMLREFPSAMRRANAAMAEFWHQNILDRHFDEDAPARYGYQPRTAEYMRLKLRKKGHQKPLTWSGVLHQELKKAATITATQNRATLIILGPKWLKGYLRMRGPKPKTKRVGDIQAAMEVLGGADGRPDKESELRRLDMKDEMDLTRVQAQTLTRRLNELNDTRTTSV